MRLSEPAVQVSSVAATFVVVTVVAKLVGAGWGVAASIGQIGFAAVLVGVLLLAPSR